MIRMKIKRPMQSEKVFAASAIVVNGGNYIYNLILGRTLGPTKFADATILVTLIMIISFVAMAFQLSVSKFITEGNETEKKHFVNSLKTLALIVGIGIAVAVGLHADGLQHIFHTQSSAMFVVFAAGIPFFILGAVNRGYHQGQRKFLSVSISYQLEMLSRLIVSLLLITFFAGSSSLMLAIGVTLSLAVSIFPVSRSGFSSFRPKLPTRKFSIQLFRFAGATLLFEFAIILINNSDLLLANYFLPSLEAGWYGAISVIGKAAFYFTWVFVMVNFPFLNQAKATGADVFPLFVKKLKVLVLPLLCIVLGTLLLPELIVEAMFGKAYKAIAPQLWKYALATTLFAVSAVFVYYFLSIERYEPALISLLTGFAQVVLLFYFNHSIDAFLELQLALMSGLFIAQVFFFLAVYRQRIFPTAALTV